MRKSVYTRPDKRKVALRPEKVAEVDLEEVAICKPIIVDRGTECHVTPPDVASRMIYYLNPSEHERVLEPSAGTGNLVQALLDAGVHDEDITTIERNYQLHEHLKDRFAHSLGGMFSYDFLEWAAAQHPTSKWDCIIMNPPFSKVKQHIEAAVSLLRDDYSNLVALVPVTFNDDRFSTVEFLPEDTFAACKVRTKIIDWIGD